MNERINDNACDQPNWHVVSDHREIEEVTKVVLTLLHRTHPSSREQTSSIGICLLLFPLSSNVQTKVSVFVKLNVNMAATSTLRKC